MFAPASQAKGVSTGTVCVSFLQEEIPRQLQYICLYLIHIAGAYLLK